MSMHINFIQRKPLRERLWKTLNVVVGISTILNVSMVGVLIHPTAVAAANPSANLDQCANDPAPSPSTDGCSASASDWVNGNLGASKSVYFEGDSIPYRMTFDNLSLASHTVIVEWDTTKSSTHALDFLTTYNRTVATANPTLGVSSPGASMTFPIPVDPQVTGAGVTPIAGNFTMWGGTITGVSTYAYADGTGFSGDKTARITITFTATNDHPTLAWGGHISHRNDWGAGNSAVTIPGSPYHTRLIDLDSAGGNQDRSLSADAVIYPGSITVVKQATPEGSQSFGFTDTGGLSPTSFSLVDDGTSANTKAFTNITNFTTYTVSETLVSGWSLSFNNPVCTVTTANGGSQSASTPTITVNLKEGENVTCTFNNSRDGGNLTVNKNVDTNGDGQVDVTGATDWTWDITSGEQNIATGQTRTLTTGSYTISEDQKANYHVTDLTCGGQSQGATTSGTVNITKNGNLTCTFTNTRNTGSIELKKTWSGTPGQTTLNIGTTAGASDVDTQLTGAAGTAPLTTGPNPVVTGTYFVSETGGLTNYTSSLACTDNGSPVTPGANNAVAVTTGHAVVCTFTNTRNQGTIELKKVWSGTPGQTTLNIGTTAGASDVESQLTGVAGAAPLTTGVNTVNTGTYFVSENGGLSNYHATLACMDNGSPVTPGANNAVSVTTGHAVNCTFTNTRDTGTLTVRKNLDTNGDGQVDQSNVSTWTWDIQGGEQNITTGLTRTLDTGAYTISEDQQADYHVTDLSCNGQSYGAVTSGQVAVTNGGSLVCTFTNTRDTGTVIVHKLVDTDANGTFESGDTSANTLGFRWQLDAGSDRLMNSSATLVLTGAHTVTENSVSAYHFVGWYPSNDTQYSCANPYSTNPSAAVNVVKDQTSAVTFCNVRDTGGLTVLKAIDTDGDGDIDTWNTGWTWDRDGGNQNYAMGSTQTVLTGSHDVTEDQQANFHSTGWTCVDSQTQASLGSGSGESLSVNVSTHGATCTFTNVRDTGTIAGHKFNDLNGNGVWDQGEPGLEGWTIQLSNGASTLTDATGAYQFTLVPTGTYTVNELLQNGWTNTTPNPVSNVAVVYHQTTTVNFGNFQKITISGQKFNDLNGDGVKNAGEPGIANWTINLDAGANGSVDATALTDGSGNYSFSNLGPGTYRLREVQQAGWTQTTANPSDVVAVSGTNVSGRDFGNFDIPTLTVIKHVINDNGGNNVAADFTMNVTGQSVSDSSFPGAEVPGTTVTLNAGAYSVDEIGLPGYAKTLSQSCSGSVQSGDDFTCTITNDDVAPTITLNKVVTNNNGGTAGVNDFGLTIGGTAVTSGQVLTVNANQAYALNEAGLTGYSFVSLTGDTKCPSVLNGTATLNEGEHVTCTITNDDIQPKLTVTKVVVNDNGGNAVVTDFPLYVGATLVTSGVQNGFNAASYVVSETNQPGYTGVISGDCDAQGNITLNVGDVKSCTITNDDQEASLTLNKVVINDNGGNAGINDFGLTIGATPVNSGDTVIVDANTPYTLSEVGLSGYAFVSLTGDAKCPSVLGGAVTLDEGEHVSCTITNDDIAPTITLNKVVINDDGGTAGVNHFGLTIGGTGVASGQKLAVSANTPIALDEAGLFGYTFVSLTGDEQCPAILGGTVTLNEGEDITCTITNDDIAPRLTVVKHVVNDNGGNAVAGDFTMNITGTNVSDPSFPGAEVPGTTVTLNQGAYSIDEDAFTGYAKSLSADCSGSLNVGESKTCTITNDDIQPKLTVTKVVVNDNGGTKVVSDFPLYVDQTLVTSGVQNGFDAASYVVSETNLPGYTGVISGDCDAQGNVILNVGDVKSCTITNDDIQPKLTVTKVVVTDNGGHAVVADFPLYVDQTLVTSGVQNGFNADTYLVSEVGMTGYAATISGDCDAEGNISLGIGETKSCTITNDDIAPTLKLVKVVVTDNGGNETAGQWTLTASGNQGFSDAGDSTTFHTVKANVAYTLSENGPTGYTPSAWSCNGGSLNGSVLTLDVNQNVTCTITNNDVAPTITLNKSVTNDNGGTAGINSFGLTIGSTAVTSGQVLTVNANQAYALNEAGLTGYSFVSLTGDAKCPSVLNGTVTLNEGEHVTCTIANDDIAPQLTVIKHVINDNGGQKVAGDFTMNATGTNVSDPSFPGAEVPGTTVTLDQGNYTVTETPIAGYASSFSTDCAGTIAVGQHKTCTITNDDIVSTINLVKTASPSIVPAGQNITYTLTWSVSGDNPVHSAIVTDPIPANTTFVSANCVTTIGACVMDHSTPIVSWSLGTRNAGESGTLTLVVKTASPITNGTVITNTGTFDTTETAPVNSTVLTPISSAPILSIIKSNDVVGFTNPGKQVTYTVTVINAASATDTARAVNLTDLLPAGFTYLLGGATTKSFLLGDIAPGASVVTTYTAVIASNQPAGFNVNTATALGSNTSAVSATSTVEVRVPSILGATTTPELVLTKTVTPKVTNPGKIVTYTVTISNPSDVDLTNVSLSDVLPKGFTFVDTGLATKSWAIGTLKAHHQRVVNYQVHIGDTVKPGTYENTATVLSNELDPQTVKRAVEVKAPKVLGLATTGVSARDYLIFSLGTGLFGLGLFWLSRQRRSRHGRAHA